jgi:acyl-CoA synthetase (AMP-forming)/AMP-acid ligase II
MFHGQCWGLPQTAVHAAAKIVLPGRYTADDPKVLVNAMIAEQVTLANGAPAIFQPMMDYIKSLPVGPDFSRARLLSGATEPPLPLMRDFFRITGAQVIHAYGATETTITAHPRIKEAAVVGAWHPKWQERPVVVAVTGDGEKIPIEEIHQLLSGSFATWQLPDTVLYVDALPRTSVGKLDKKAMRAAYADIYRQTT